MYHSAQDIAAFLFNLTPYNSTDEADELSWSKLKCLLYYAQGFALVRLGRPFFEEDFTRGPNEYSPLVLGSIDELYSGYGGAPIPHRGVYHDGLDKEELGLINDVYDMFGVYTPAALKNMALASHPVRRASPGWIIPKRTMKSYFRNEYFTEDWKNER